MATYKAEFLAHHYERRIRPAAHYSMGWLPVWARVAGVAPRVANAVAGAPVLAPAFKRIAGIDDRRTLPEFAATSLRRWFRGRRPTGSGVRGEVLLWPDTFTTAFAPEIARAAVAVLEDAGWRVVLPKGHVCCGLTWLSTGQLGIAKRILGRSVAALAPYARGGVPIVGLEPSCTAVFRRDAVELLPVGSGVADVRDRTYTLAELLTAHTPGWEPPQIGGRAVVQPHCHQHAVLGFVADERLLAAAGVETTTVGGCCGLAGDFGFARGHYDVSIACAEQQLLPAVRAAPDAAVLADGFSCRTQLADTTGRRAVHLAELLAGVAASAGHV
jgi:Fe-S oxidoreductase